MLANNETGVIQDLASVVKIAQRHGALVLDCAQAMCASTESVHNIVGFGAACEDVNRLVAHAEPTRALRRELIQRLKAIKPDCVINSPEAESEYLPNTLSVTFPGFALSLKHCP